MDGVVARISNKAVFGTINVFPLKKVVYYFAGVVHTIYLCSGNKGEYLYFYLTRTCFLPKHVTMMEGALLLKGILLMVFKG
ncbi:hypothetical protein Barb4_00511 [Bacteroidales bacterium Barb4]|nr:hypothetical protein Barb4_00511 [Bacteroidales bacterium Barb4]